jgi:hypothetical protein
MLHRADAHAGDWKTVYEDADRKIQARGRERRAIDATTGKIIIEYSV